MASNPTELKVLTHLNSDYVSKSVLRRGLDVDINLDSALDALIEKGLIEGISLSGIETDHFKLTEKGHRVKQAKTPQRAAESLRSMDSKSSREFTRISSEREAMTQKGDERGRDAKRDGRADHHGNVRRRILVVDDDGDITLGIKLGLESRGFDVDVFNDPEGALGSVAPGKYDIAIFDIRMPKMNGFELYRHFKNLDGGTEVCFLTGFELYATEFEKLFPDVKARAFFMKPIAMADLAERLNSLLEAKDAGS